MKLAVVNTDLVRAINEKRLIEFTYKTGRTRVVEPHDYGTRNDTELLLAFQISGDSRSGAAEGWKSFDITQMRQLRVLDETFAGSRADDAQRHGGRDRLFARVK